ncbi:MAG: dipeptidase, partial [Chloroflexota bacterium]
PPGSRDAAGYGQPHQQQSLAWTNWPLFTVGLVQRGYSDADIQQILGGNVLRVARAALASAQP